MELAELVENEPSVRAFKCSWEGCVKGFNRKSDLQRHYRIHTDERPFKCDYGDCRKAFIQRSALTVHTRTHTGEKPHICEHVGCGKPFSDSSSLARHRRIHTGKRPYTCDHKGCTKSFCRKTTMVKHWKRTHQRARQSTGLDESASEGGSPPPTPDSHAAMPWAAAPHALPGHPPQLNHPGQIQQPPPYPGFGQHMPNYGMHQQGPPQGVPNNGMANYHPAPIMSQPPPLEAPGHPQQQQHPPPYDSMQMMQQQTPRMPVSYYVPEQNNPGVATMTTLDSPGAYTVVSGPPNGQGLYTVIPSDQLRGETIHPDVAAWRVDEFRWAPWPLTKADFEEDISMQMPSARINDM
jgi:hypothetical protein